MKKRILTVLLCVAVILTCLTACGGNKASDGNVSGGNVSDSDITEQEITVADEKEDKEKTAFFSDFTTTALDGKEYTQKIFEGNKVTMVNIWGTFCSPCINEMPDLEKLSKDYADKGLVIVGVVSDVYDYLKDENNADKIADAEAIVAQTGVTYTNLLPSESLNASRLDYVSTFPTTYFLDENGVILGEYIGSRSYDQWSIIIDTMLEVA